MAEYNVISMFHEICTKEPYVLPEKPEEVAGEKPSAGPTVTGTNVNCDFVNSATHTCMIYLRQGSFNGRLSDTMYHLTGSR